MCQIVLGFEIHCTLLLTLLLFVEGDTSFSLIKQQLWVRYQLCSRTAYSTTVFIRDGAQGRRVRA